MKVVFVNKYYFPPHLGGVEQSLNLLASRLAEKPGFDVSAIVANEARRTVVERLDGVEVRRIGRLFAAASTPIAPGMVRVLRQEAQPPVPADLFHLQFPYPWGEVSWLRAHLKAPTVMTYHADVVRQRKAMALYAPVLRTVLARVDRVIVGAPQIIENSPFLAPIADKCRVVPFAIDYSRFEPDPIAEERVRQTAEEFGRPVVLFVGRLVYYKGVEVLLDAMAKVDAQLVVIGSGPLYDQLRQRAEALGIAERVTWLPPTTNADLGAWYRAADVFCLPSIAKTEAFGLVQLEAHAAGTPVVSSDLPSGVPFVNADGVTGLVVPPQDVDALASAIEKLLADDELRERLGRQAKERAHSEFGIQRMVDDTVAVYEELVPLH